MYSSNAERQRAYRQRKQGNRNATARICPQCKGEWDTLKRMKVCYTCQTVYLWASVDYSDYIRAMVLRLAETGYTVKTKTG